MKVLVTGATGLVGRHLSQSLIEQGFRVSALVRSSSNTAFLEKLGIEIVRGDITDATAVERAVQGCQQVYHLAAKMSAPKTSKQLYYSINVGGTENIARASLKTGVERLVYGSSVGFYGLIKHPPIDEKTPPKPNSPYRETKLLGEQRVLAEYHLHGLPVVVARIASVVGPYADNWVGLLRAISSGKFRIIGDGNNYYHTVSISNLVKGLQLCATTKNIEGHLYILADEQPVKLKNLIEWFAEELGVSICSKNSPILPFQGFQAIADVMYQRLKIQLPHAHRYNLFLTNRIFSIAKAQRELGYAPSMSLRESIRQMVGWYLNKERE